MKSFCNFLLGFFLVLCVLSLFTSWQLGVYIFLFGLAAYLFFFPGKFGVPLAFLIGITLASEVLNTYHIGSFALVALFLYGLSLLFRDLLRFTYLYGRFIVAVSLFAIVYPLFLLQVSHYFHYLSQIIPALFCVIGVTALIQYITRRPEYELL